MAALMQTFPIYCRSIYLRSAPLVDAKGSEERRGFLGCAISFSLKDGIV